MQAGGSQRMGWLGTATYEWHGGQSESGFCNSTTNYNKHPKSENKFVNYMRMIPVQPLAMPLQEAFRERCWDLQLRLSRWLANNKGMQNGSLVVYLHCLRHTTIGWLFFCETRDAESFTPWVDA